MDRVSAIKIYYYYVQVISSGVSRISFRGVFKMYLEKCGYLHGAKRHAFARGVRGHASPRKFFKMMQFGAFWRIFC